MDSRDVVASGDTRPRTEETRILGITVRKAYHAYYFDEGAYVEVHEQCITPTAVFGDASNLRTEKDIIREDCALLPPQDAFIRSGIRTVQWIPILMNTVTGR